MVDMFEIAEHLLRKDVSIDESRTLHHAGAIAYLVASQGNQFVQEPYSHIRSDILSSLALHLHNEVFPGFPRSELQE
jgi:hypothetical protein